MVQDSCARAYRTHSSVHRALVVEERERKKGEREEDSKEKKSKYLMSTKGNQFMNYGRITWKYYTAVKNE